MSNSKGRYQDACLVSHRIGVDSVRSTFNSEVVSSVGISDTLCDSSMTLQSRKVLPVTSEMLLHEDEYGLDDINSSADDEATDKVSKISDRLLNKKKHTHARKQKHILAQQCDNEIFAKRTLVGDGCADAIGSNGSKKKKNMLVHGHLCILGIKHL